MLERIQVSSKRNFAHHLPISRDDPKAAKACYSVSLLSYLWVVARTYGVKSLSLRIPGRSYSFVRLRIRVPCRGRCRLICRMLRWLAIAALELRTDMSKTIIVSVGRCVGDLVRDETWPPLLSCDLLWYDRLGTCSKLAMDWR